MHKGEDNMTYREKYATLPICRWIVTFILWVGGTAATTLAFTNVLFPEQVAVQWIFLALTIDAFLAWLFYSHKILEVLDD